MKTLVMKNENTLFLSVVNCLKLSSPSLEESEKTSEEGSSRDPESPDDLCPSRAWKYE